MKSTSLNFALLASISISLFLISLLVSFKKYAELMAAGADGAFAIIYMMVMFMIVFILVGGTVALLAGVISPIATKVIMSVIIKQPDIDNAIDEPVAINVPMTAELPKMEESETNKRYKHSIKLQEQALADKESEVLEEIFNYSRSSFKKILTPSQIDVLIQNMKDINEFYKGKSGMPVDYKFAAVENAKSLYVATHDLEHFGHNVSTRFKILYRVFSQGKIIPKFLKESFPNTFENKVETSINAKLTNDVSDLPLIDSKHDLEPYVFPQTEHLPDKIDK